MLYWKNDKCLSEKRNPLLGYIHLSPLLFLLSYEVDLKICSMSRSSFSVYLNVFLGGKGLYFLFQKTLLWNKLDCICFIFL